MATILVVEDENVLLQAIERALEQLGHRVRWASRCEQGERLFGEERPDLTLLDLRLPDGSGLDLLARLRGQDPAALSEQFGHQKGGDADAKTANVGLLQAADRGTIFFDETREVVPAVADL